MKTKKMTKTEIQTTLTCSAVSKNRAGNYIAKWSYFYHHGRTAEGYVAKVQDAFPTAIIIQTGDHFHAFCGGAKSGSARDSYMWVEFQLDVPAETQP